MNVNDNFDRSCLELWGGVECTINRVQHEYFEQLARSGHLRRLSDLDAFAGLGIKALRFPVLWESVAPSGLENATWDWCDAALAKVRSLGIRPIVGLIHHGGGPRSTSLLDPEFPHQLSVYAESVARRYPWIQDYTPVNEPLTTARFSALYGHWYPHHKNDLSFSRALLNQCRAVVLAMRSIRQVNSSARLIQTDDLGKVFSTPKLAYQAEFENERRWCSYDLLCGRLNRNHPMWGYFLWAGIQESELEWFLDNPCPPDVIGINHYLSGERYLDENLERYPPECHGGNGRDSYADVLAARVLQDGTAGPAALMIEAWQRFGLPVAVTECHNGCTREEQLRWFLEVWHSAEHARERGANVIAVTAWSLLGAFDWNHLVTRKNDHYEPGVYDIRSAAPRPTALASLITTLSAGKGPNHPLLAIPGWWRRSQRFVYDFCVNADGESCIPGRAGLNETHPHARPVLITGARGKLGSAFGRICEARGIPYRLLSRSDLDIADPHSIRRALFRFNPWAVINTAGFDRVDAAEENIRDCFRENTDGPVLLARECVERDIQFLTFSSDLVFDGAKSVPYVESNPVGPVNIYGLSKAKSEELVLAIMPSALVVRSSALFGPWDDHNFAFQSLRALAASKTFRAISDVTVSPTYVPDLVNAALDLLIDRESGIWHLANAGQSTWFELAADVAEFAKVSTGSLRSCRLQDLNLPAKRPLYTALSSERAILLPSLQDALRRYVADCQLKWDRSQTEMEKVAA